MDPRAAGISQRMWLLMCSLESSWCGPQVALLGALSRLDARWHLQEEMGDEDEGVGDDSVKSVTVPAA